MSENRDYALDMSGISKRFGPTLVLDDVTFRVRPGRIHGLVGHNGAGKSTLMKIALGAVPPTTGTVSVGGQQLTFSRPAEARNTGAGMVLQELSLIPTLSVADNIFLNAERTGWLGIIAGRSERREARLLLEELGITGVSPSALVGELSIAQQQMVEIAKAFRLGRRLLILDEPTAPLSRHEVARLFALVRKAAELGTGIVFITHHLREVFEVCEEVTVLRGGREVLSARTTETSLDEVVAALVGGSLAVIEAGTIASPPPGQAPVLEVEGLTVKGKLEDLSFTLRRGEVVGIAGLAGSGRTTLLQTLFGAISPDRGTVRLEGVHYHPRGPAGAIARGVFLVPEDRHVHGVILEHTIEQNAVLPVLRALRWLCFYSARAAGRAVEWALALFDVKTSGRHQIVQELSGGNQQKVVLAKALLSHPRLLLLDEPTFGVDVQTAAEIIRKVREEVAGGRAALWVSSDLTELLQVSDRILVLADGGIKHVLRRGAADFTEETLLHAMQRTGANGPPAQGSKGMRT
jgi:ribose transport system ATP-binding protein